MKRRLTIMGCVAILCVMMLSLPVFAVTESFNWKFNSTAGTLSTTPGKKNDTEQRYYITISSGNVSSYNVFGTRMKKGSNNAFVSEYELHTSLKQSVPYYYNTTVYMNTNYYMSGKKDSSSTSGTALRAQGKVTY